MPAPNPIPAYLLVHRLLSNMSSIAQSLGTVQNSIQIAVSDTLMGFEEPSRRCGIAWARIACRLPFFISGSVKMDAGTAWLLHINGKGSGVPAGRTVGDFLFSR